MQIYLPIAEISVSIHILLILGFVAGVMAGIFGVGGGFIITPLLIFNGIPTHVAVASSSNQIIAASMSGFLANWKKKRVDFQIGSWLIAGGVIGAIIGINLVAILKQFGYFELIVGVIYTFMLSAIGCVMVCDLVKNGKPKEDHKTTTPKTKNSHKFATFSNLSQICFRIDKTIILGILAGIMVCILGIGGGFIIVPAMIYLLRIPEENVVGTSLLQIIVITSLVTILQSINFGSVDMILATVMFCSSVIGAQFGTIINQRSNPIITRFILGAVMVFLGLKMSLRVFTPPNMNKQFTFEKVENISIYNQSDDE